MKKLILLLLLCSMSIKAQTESNNITIMTAIGAYDDGFNIGVQYEYQLLNAVYVGLESVYFPDLNDLDYLHLIARMGANVEFNNIRPYGGLRVGRIWRENNSGPYALLGLETGIQVTFSKWNNIYGKLFYTYDSKTDSAIWNEDNHQVWSIWSGIGIRF